MEFGYLCRMLHGASKGSRPRIRYVSGSACTDIGGQGRTLPQRREAVSGFLFIFEKIVSISIMVIERTTDEFVIRFPLTADTEQMQDIMDYLRYKELTANRRIAQSEVDKLSREVNRRWWEQNADKFKK